MTGDTADWFTDSDPSDWDSEPPCRRVPCDICGEVFVCTEGDDAVCDDRWRRPGVIDEFRTRFMAGMRANGLSDDFSLAAGCEC